MLSASEGRRDAIGLLSIRGANNECVLPVTAGATWEFLPVKALLNGLEADALGKNETVAKTASAIKITGTKSKWRRDTNKPVYLVLVVFMEFSLGFAQILVALPIGFRTVTFITN
jgi:hypothetical protein